LALWQVALAAGLLIATTWIVFTLRQNRPYLLVGWLWYLIMLLPVIGIVEVGLQGHADRYAYLPQVGLYIALTWLAGDISASLRYRKEILATVGIGTVIVLSACAWKQTTYWQSSETLWMHTLAVTTDNDVSMTNLGTVLFRRHDLNGAISEWRTTLSLHPNDPGTNANLGNALVQKGLLREAANHYEIALQSEPDSPLPLNNLAWLMSAGPDDSLRNGVRAVELARNLHRVSNQNNPFF